MRRSLTVVLPFLFALALQCAETNFVAPVGPAPSIRQASTMQRVRLVFEGESAFEKSWLRSYAVSRLFSSRVVNHSGSFADLMQPAIAEALFERDYLVVASDSTSVSADERQGKPSSASGEPKVESAAELKSVVIRLEKRDLQWAPPQEFIETIRPHRRGRYSIDLEITVLYPDQSRWTFDRSVNGEAYPGEEIARMEAVVHGLLEEFLWGMLDRLPAAKRTVP